jgi:SulP family sulfate permease
MTAPRARSIAIPGIRAIRRYDRSWLPIDALAGLTVWALLVPQALAYAQLGGFDAVVGLYASLGALLGYALMGGVREMSVGPEATIALLTASIIAPLAEGDPSRYLALGAGIALMAGVLLVLAGLARLGFVTRYLSRPLLVGYVAGSAIVMIVSQLDSLIGITLVAQDDTLAELTETLRRLGETDPTTLAVGLGVIAVVLATLSLITRRNSRHPLLVVGLVALGILILSWRVLPRSVRDRAISVSQALAIVDDTDVAPTPDAVIGAGIYLGVIASAAITLFGLTIVVKRVAKPYAVVSADDDV